MQEKIEKSNEDLILSFSPRNLLSKSVDITKKYIENIIFYKRILENKNQLEIKKWSHIPENVIKHIIEYNYDVLNPNLTYCIDDRTEEKQKKWVSIPWWTDWLLAAWFHYITELWLDKDISCKQIYSSLLDTIWWTDNYYTHSDTHNIKNKWGIWCWHCNVAFNNWWHILDLADKYKQFMLDLRNQNKKNTNLDILKWEHSPEWVILIDNEYSPEKLSIIQKGTNSQFFVYNRNAEKNILKRFIKNLNNNENINIALDEKELDLIAFKAYLSTLEHLWAWNLPHYTIKYNEKTWHYRIKTIWDVNTFIKNHK